MNKITFVNNTSPLLSAENLNAIQNNTEMAIIEAKNEIIEEKEAQAVFCKLQQDLPTSNNYQDIATWTQILKIGDQINVNNGQIIIGQNVNHIKISTKLWIILASTGDAYTYIRKNGSNVAGTWQVIYVTGQRNGLLNSQAIIEVEEGDIITCNIYGTGQLNSNTSIIVEKID